MAVDGIDAKTGTEDAAEGLRGRKKARRRENILSSARVLFAEKGVDATTMAEIAEAVEISPPTVFNYFGSKDGLLIALIAEGAQKARAVELAVHPRTDSDFCTILVEYFERISQRTLAIAGKRIWRYAEAATIRRPTTELSRQYEVVDEELLRGIIAFMDMYVLSLRAGTPPDAAELGRIFLDVWNGTFFALIRDENRTLKQHKAHMQARFGPLTKMLFDDEFLSKPRLKQSYRQGLATQGSTDADR